MHFVADTNGRAIERWTIKRETRRASVISVLEIVHAVVYASIYVSPQTGPNFIFENMISGE